MPLPCFAALLLVGACHRAPPQAEAYFASDARELAAELGAKAADASDANAPPVAPAPRPVEATPRGYVKMTVAGVFPRHRGAAVLLEDETHRTVIPIVVGGAEAMSIRLRLEHAKFVRPLTHDLVDAITRTLGAEVAKAQVDDVDGEILLGSVYLRKDGKDIRTDARPSDAIALALGSDAPIFVAKSVVDVAGVPRDLILKKDGDGERLELPGETTAEPREFSVSL